MTMAAAELPDDIEALKALVLSARRENAELRAVKADADARLERPHALLKALERSRYGRRSEGLDPDQHAFVFEEVETGIGAAEAALDTVTAGPLRTANCGSASRCPNTLSGSSW